MIVVDVEGTGTEPEIHGILSIGAVDFSRPERQFYDECRAWEGAHINDEALLVNGFSKEEAKDPSKRTEKEVVRAFIAWALDSGEHTIAGHSPSYDRDFIRHAAKRSHLDWPFAYRTLDTHSMCYLHMVQNGITPPILNGRSALNLDTVLQYVGLPAEPKPHNALNGARLAAEAISRLLYGTSLFDDYRDYKMPW